MQQAKLKKILITGVAGFIGAKVAERLLAEGISVVGVDNLNAYYDVRLKKHRLKQLSAFESFTFVRENILSPRLERVFKSNRFDAVINLAAQAGVAGSVQNPFAYLESNTRGTLQLLEYCKNYKVPKFFLSSTSSVYTGCTGAFSETFAANTPYSPYAASKKAAEGFCHAYHYLYGMDVVLLRYFNVYGPAGRPDMAPFKFISSIQKGKSLTIYGDGKQTRDFTYIDDIADGTVMALRKLKGFQILNLGNNRPFPLLTFIRLIEKNMGKKAKLNFTAPIKADPKDTRADISKAKKLCDWQPRISLEEGVKRTVAWYLKNEKWLSKIKPGYNPAAFK